MTVTGTCHCKATRFSVAAAPTSVTRCNCTFCSKRGMLWAYYEPDEVSIEADASDAIYEPRMNKHHFCATCGCSTYSKTPVWDPKTYKPIPGKTRIGINARLLDDFDLDAVEVKSVDGLHQW